MGHEAGLDVSEIRKISRGSADILNPDRPSYSPVTVYIYHVLYILYNFRYQQDKYACNSDVSFMFRRRVLSLSAWKETHLAQLCVTVSSKCHAP